MSTPDCPAGSNGVSGDISLTTGGTTLGTSGSIQLKTSDGNYGVGGDIVLKVGAGNTGKGGQVSIEAGTTSEASNTAALGGDIYLRGGNSSSQNGGTLYFVSGYTMSNGKVGGNLDLNAGTGDIIMKSATVDVTTTTFTVNGNTAVTGTLDVANDFAVNTDKFKVIAASGDTSIAGTIAVDGDV